MEAFANRKHDVFLKASELSLRNDGQIGLLPLK